MNRIRQQVHGTEVVDFPIQPSQYHTADFLRSNYYCGFSDKIHYCGFVVEHAGCNGSSCEEKFILHYEISANKVLIFNIAYLYFYKNTPIKYLLYESDNNILMLISGVN